MSPICGTQKAKMHTLLVIFCMCGGGGGEVVAGWRIPRLIPTGRYPLARVIVVAQFVCLVCLNRQPPEGYKATKGEVRVLQRKKCSTSLYPTHLFHICLSRSTKQQMVILRLSFAIEFLCQNECTIAV